MAETPWWVKENYLAGKEIGAGLWVCLAQMVTTVRLMVCTPAPDGGLVEFWCYPHMDLALLAFDVYDGHGDPAIGWVKHHPSHRRNCPSCFTNKTEEPFECHNIKWHSDARRLQGA